MSDEVPILSAGETISDKDTHVSASGKSKQYQQIKVTGNSQAHLGDVHNHNYHVTVGTIATIIDVATRSITTLAGARNQFKEANILVTSLSTQLVSVRTALDQIKKLIEESFLDDQHYQLVMDLDTATKGCHLLLGVLDEHISKLEYSEGGQLTFKNRLSTILESKGVEQCLSRLDRQIIALNVIITAYTAREPFRQKQALEARKAREAFENVKDDTASLYVLYDSASFMTSRTITTTRTSRFSLNFDFDAELMSHKAYKAAFRSLLRRSSGLRRTVTGAGPSQLRYSEALSEAQQAAYNDRVLEHEREASREITTILFMGHDVRRLLAHFALSYDGLYVREKRSAFRQAVKATISTVSKLLENEEGAKLSSDLEMQRGTLMAAVATDAIDLNINSDVAEAIRFCAKYLMSNDQHHYQLDSRENYLLNNAERIFEPGYIPSVQDVLNLTTTDEAFGETYLIPVQYSLSLSVSSPIQQRPWPFRAAHVQQQSLWPKWMGCPGDATAFIYCIDLLSYAHVNPDNLKNKLTESLDVFDSIVRLVRTRMCVMLVFCNFADFERRLLIDPLANHFPDYRGGNDIDRAAKYILQQFKKAHRPALEMDSIFCNLTDPTDLQQVPLMIGNIFWRKVTSRILREAGFL